MMTTDPISNSPVTVIALTSANARSYLSAVFAAYRAGDIVMVLPKGSQIKDVPGVSIKDHQSYEDDPGWFSDVLPVIDTDTPAQIAFSSGTTGTPKALLLSHRALNDVVTRINDAMGVTDEIREYIGVPVTFSFGFGRARAVAVAGGRSYLPPNGFDPSEIATMLKAGEINSISAVPTLWRVMLANPDVIGDAGASLRWIEIGSQFMSGDEKAALKLLFPNAKIVQHYGLTEASRSTLLDISGTTGAALESVGKPTGETEIQISEDGVIQVRGPHVAMGRISESGVDPIVDSDGWLTTSDRGHVEEGFLFYGGRTDELINCGGLKIDPTRFEQRLQVALGVSAGIAVGRQSDDLRGERVLVAYTDAAGVGRDQIEKATLEIGAEFGLTGAGVFAFKNVTDIPVTGTGKVRRGDLEGLPVLTAHTSPTPMSEGTQIDLVVPASDQAAALQGLWGDVLGVPHVAVDQSFYDLGGDSLSALTVILRMESLGLDPEVARGIFDGKTIMDLVGDDLENSPETGGPVSSIDVPLSLAEAVNSVHATRGILILWVVVIHWLPGFLGMITSHADTIYKSLEPVLRFGTPGFAIVFGLGIGALGLVQYSSNKALFLKATRINTIPVVGGVFVLALIRFLREWTGEGLDDALLWSKLFYSAIAFYALARLTMPLVMRVLTIGSSRVLTILSVMVAALLINEILSMTVAPLRPEGFLELSKILLTAKYGYFRMMAYVMAGVAIGYIFRANHARLGIVRDLFVAGLALGTLGFILVHEVQPDAILDGFGQVLPWHLMIYSGAVLMILSAFSWLNRNGQASFGAVVRRLNAFAIASGILALPIFVGHELVLPTRSVMVNLGLPGSISLLITMGLFVVGMGVAYRRLLKFLIR